MSTLMTMLPQAVPAIQVHPPPNKWFTPASPTEINALPDTFLRSAALKANIPPVMIRFGKHANQLVDYVARNHRGYLPWVLISNMSASFSPALVTWLKEVISRGRDPAVLAAMMLPNPNQNQNPPGSPPADSAAPTPTSDDDNEFQRDRTLLEAGWSPGDSYTQLLKFQELVRKFRETLKRRVKEAEEEMLRSRKQTAEW